MNVFLEKYILISGVLAFFKLRFYEKCFLNVSLISSDNHWSG